MKLFSIKREGSKKKELVQAPEISDVFSYCDNKNNTNEIILIKRVKSTVLRTGGKE